MLEVYEICIIFISLILVLNSINKTVKTNKVIYLIHLLFFFVFILPLILDYLIGYPSYSGLHYGFKISFNDTSTRYVYATYILISQFIMLIVGNSSIKFGNRQFGKKERDIGYNKKLQSTSTINESSLFVNKYTDFLLICTSLITVVLVLVFPMSKEILWNFGWRDLGIGIEGEKYYSTVERLSYISIASGIIFLFKKDRNIFIKGLFISLIYMSICVEAKRSIIFFTSVLILTYLLFNTRMTKRKWIYILGSMVVFGLLSYSIYVKATYRGYVGFEDIYTTLRIDFFRDDTVKMVIYSIITPNTMQIFEYPGQSIVTQIGSLFPLQFLKVPSIGYNSFLTSWLIGIPMDKYTNWMTTSIFDEMLANFGLLGFWIAPSVLGVFARVADKQNNKFIPLTIGVVLLLMMYSPNYIMWFIQFWFVFVIIERSFRKKKKPLDIRMD